MFIHSKLLAEQKFNNVMKLVKKTNMSSYWFMENHFIPCLFHKNSNDLGGFLTVLEKSFQRLVEATVGFGQKNKELYGGEKAEQDVIEAMKKFLTNNEDGLTNLLSNVHIPEITMGKTALLRKLSNDIVKFVDNYKFSHPENMPPEEFKKSSDFMDENLERKTVNQMLGKRISMLLGYEGNVFDDVSNFNQENIKRYYKGLLDLENSKFNPQQEKFMATHGFAKEGIVNLAKKIMEVLRKKAAHHVISTTGHQEAEKLFGQKPEEIEADTGVGAGFEDEDEDEVEDTAKEPAVSLNRYKDIFKIETLLKKEFNSRSVKIDSKASLIQALKDGKFLKINVVKKLKKLENIYKDEVPNATMLFDIQLLLRLIEPMVVQYKGTGSNAAETKKVPPAKSRLSDEKDKTKVTQKTADEFEDEFKPNTRFSGGNPFE